jgi:hypothetical protein
VLKHFGCLVMLGGNNLLVGFVKIRWLPCHAQWESPFGRGVLKIRWLPCHARRELPFSRGASK